MTFIEKKEATAVARIKQKSGKVSAGIAAALAAGAAAFASKAGAASLVEDVVSYVIHADKTVTVTLADGSEMTYEAGRYIINGDRVVLLDDGDFVSGGAALLALLGASGGDNAGSEAEGNDAETIDPVKSFTLSHEGTDPFIGGNNDDVISGEIVSADPDDNITMTYDDHSIDGGEGFDTLNFEVDVGARSYIELPEMTSIEKIVINHESGSSLSLSSVHSIDTELKYIDATSQNGNKSLYLGDNMPTTGLEVKLSGYEKGPFYSSLGTDIKLLLDEVGSDAEPMEIRAAQLTALTLEGLGDATSRVEPFLNALETLTITGTAPVSSQESDLYGYGLSSYVSNLKEIDASGNSGGVTILTHSKLLETVVGGTGDDTFAFGGEITGDIELTGGAGADTFDFFDEDAFAAGKVATITDFEVGNGGDVLKLHSSLVVSSNVIASATDVISTDSGVLNIITYPDFSDDDFDLHDAADVAVLLSDQSVQDDVSNSGKESVILLSDGEDASAYVFISDGDGVIGSTELTQLAVFEGVSDLGSVTDYNMGI